MLRLQGRSPFCQEIHKKHTVGVQQGTLQILNCTIEEWKFHTLVWVITLSLVTPQSYSVIFPDDEFEVTWLENGTTIKVFSNHKLKHESLWKCHVLPWCPWILLSLSKCGSTGKDVTQLKRHASIQFYSLQVLGIPKSLRIMVLEEAVAVLSNTEANIAVPAFESAPVLVLCLF